MHLSEIYNKSLTFFSRTHQEELVLKLEHQFYNVITVYNRDQESRRQLRHKMEEIGKQIYRSITHYYFEDDLLEYLFSLATFIMNYMQEIEAEPTSKRELSLNHKFFNQEQANFNRN